MIVARRGWIEQPLEDAAARRGAMQHKTLRLASRQLDDDRHTVIFDGGQPLVDESRPQTHRLALDVLAAIRGEHDGPARLRELRAAQGADGLHPIAGEIRVAGSVAPPPRLVGGMEQHLARPHVL